MALVKKNPAADGFEQDDSVATAPAPAQQEGALAQATPEQKAAADVQATVAIAKAATGTAVATHVEKRKLRDFIGELENRLPAVGFGEAPRIVAASGVFKDADKTVLGTFLELTLLSWNFTYTIRTGDQGEASKEYVKYSRNKEKFDDGTLVVDYLKLLRETHGYPNASLEEYVELVGLLESTEKAYVNAGSGRLVVISLSPDSVKTFNGLRRDTSVGYMLGRVEASDEPRLKIVTEPRAARGRDWTRMVVSLV